MIKAACFEDQEFATKQDLFAALIKNESKLISLKKASIQNSIDKGQLSSFELLKETDATKTLLSFKSDHIYPVINTTRYLDSHDDVHFDGLWSKSLKEQQGKIFYVFDHSINARDIIAWPEDVKAFAQSIPWSFVGKNYDGNTEALIYEIPISAIDNEQAKSIIDKRRPVQNSVRMRYVRIKMAIDSDEKDYATQKAYFDARVNDIVNKDLAKENGYFFGVEEAEIKHEGSMVILASNDATSIIYADAGKSTSAKSDAPDDSTRQPERKKILI